MDELFESEEFCSLCERSNKNNGTNFNSVHKFGECPLFKIDKRKNLDKLIEKIQREYLSKNYRTNKER